MRGRSESPLSSAPNVERASADRIPYLYIRVSPNPVVERADVEIYGLYSVQGKDLRLVLSDLRGRELVDLSATLARRNGVAEATAQLDVAGLPSGMYLLTLTAGEDVFTRRIAITK